MKKFLILSTILFFVPITSQAQNNISPWKKIDSLENVGQIKSALENVLLLQKEARTEQDWNQIAKTYFYRWKFQELITEESKLGDLAHLDSLKKVAPKSYKGIFSFVKARMIKSFYDQNRYNIRRSHLVKDTINTQMATWSEDQFLFHYLDEISEVQSVREALLELPAEAIAPILQPSLSMRHYRPTVYDILLGEFISDLQGWMYFDFQEETSWNLPESVQFDVDGEFPVYEFPAEVHGKGRLKTEYIKLLQEIESAHSRDSLPDALVFSQLARLEYFVGNNSTRKRELYEGALRRLIEKYRSDRIASLVKFQLATHYSGLAQYNEKEYPDAHRKAAALCLDIVWNYKETEAFQRAKTLLGKIQRESISVYNKEYVPVGKPSRVRLEYRNLEELTLRIVRLNMRDEKKTKTSFLNDSVSNWIKNLKNVVHTEKIKLLGRGDGNSHSTEIVVPPLEPGNYLLLFTNDTLIKTNSFGHSNLKVTDMALLRNDSDTEETFRFVHRFTGEPLVHLDVRITKLKTGEFQIMKTDDKGKLLIPKYDHNEHGSIELLAVRNKDTLVLGDHIDRKRVDYDDEEEQEGKVVVLLDRHIYRPGQTVYFKGVFLIKKGNKTRVVPRQRVLVYIEDANGDEVLEKEYKTNGFGSFSDSLVLPKTGGLGEYTISVEEPDEENRFWEKFWDTGDLSYDEFTFRVEEYKRPRFEIIPDPVKDVFRLNDTVTLSGTAKSYMGAAVANAAVNYTIRRTEIGSFRYYYNEGDFVKEDKVQTDHNGQFVIRFYDSISSQQASHRPIYKYNIHLTVTDIGGETRESDAFLFVSDRSFKSNIELADKLFLGDSLNLRISTQNLSEQLVTSQGKLSIYTKNQDAIYKVPRLWNRPEFESISKEDFEVLFPYEKYSEVAVERGDRVFSLEYESDGIFEKALPLALNEGDYELELIVTGERGEKDTLKKSFQVLNPQIKKLTNGKRFEFIYQEAASDGKYARYSLNTSLDSLYVFVDARVGGDSVYEEMILLEGRKDIEIPISSAKGKRLSVEFYQVIYNELESEVHNVDLTEAPIQLCIESQTFRSKLYPNQQEEWRFVIKNEGGIHTNSEVLATMYDASLDQFVKDDWPEFGFRNYWWGGYARMHGESMFQSTSGRFFNRAPIYYFTVPPLERINFFGLDKVSSKYAYESYVKSIAAQAAINPASGNTRGVVLDDSGVPLPGVNVIVKGTDRGTQTNFDGEFAIDASPEDILVFSYVGFNSTELVASSTPVYVNMEAGAQLNEVVVSGYAVKREKVMLASSVSYVTVSVGDQVSNKFPSSDLESLLSGHAAGVQITQSAGRPGAISQIVIRGVSSVDSINRALVIIDGVPMDFSNPQNLTTLSADDISNVVLLKGEQATSLYGSRGQNGVLVITTKKTMEALQEVEVRKNLKETAFFYPHLRTNQKGEIAFSFITPEVLTKWKLRMQAHSKKGAHGRALLEAVTTKDFSILPNLPRFIREGDSITLKATVNNLSSDLLRGTALIEFFDVHTNQSIEGPFLASGKFQSFELSPGINQVVQWAIAMPKGMELVGIRVKAVAGKFSDGEEHVLPILPNRMLVTESSPFLVRANKEATVSLKGIVESTPTKTAHKVILEVNENPIWDVLKSMPYLLEFPYECAEQTFSRFYANKMTEALLKNHPEIRKTLNEWQGTEAMENPLERNEDLKSIVVEETPWLRDSKNENANRQRLAAVLETNALMTLGTETLVKMDALQNADGGFPWFSGGKSNRYISSYILAGFGRMHSLGIQWEGGPDIQQLINYLDREILKAYNDYRKRHKDAHSYFKSSQFLFYLYARSLYMELYPECVVLEAHRSVIYETYEDSWLSLSLFQKANLINSSQRLGWTDLAESILNALQESVVESKINGAYWKSNVSGLHWDEAKVEAHALMIEAFYNWGKNPDLLKELKLWLLQQKRTHSWNSTKATTEATYALLLGRDSIDTSPHKVTYLTGDNKTDAKISEAQTSPTRKTNLRVTWERDEISKSLGILEINNQGEDPIYGGFYYQYFEDLDKITTDTNEQIQVERSYYIKENQEWLPLDKGTALTIGDKVLVRLILTAATDLEFIHIKDQRASGLEPLETLSGYQSSSGLYYYRTNRDTASHFFVDEMDRGTYVLEYELVANNAGSFSAGVSTIECMYAPEYSSHSKGVKIKIVD